MSFFCSPPTLPPLQFVQPHEVVFAVDRGTPLLDVRPPNEYAGGHIEGAKPVPLYRPITGLSFRAIARRAVFLFFGVLNGTEANPDFIAQAEAALAGARECIVYCNIGGKIDGTETKKDGQMSRSLSAAFELVNGGVVDKVSILQDGVNGWLRSERETVVD